MNNRKSQLKSIYHSSLSTLAGYFANSFFLCMHDFANMKVNYFCLIPNTPASQLSLMLTIPTYFLLAE